MSARYVVDEKGERREVILTVEEYERLRIAGEETEKMSRHPGVVFEGPAGRRIRPAGRPAGGRRPRTGPVAGR